MRQLFLLCLLLCSSSYGQTSLKDIDLDYGEYAVGFKQYIAYDDTRTYNRVNDYTNKINSRPVSVSIWYPAKDIADAQKMTVLNYFEVLKVEEEWENLPNEQILNWFYYTKTRENESHFKEQVNAYSKAPSASGQFPVIFYAASRLASSVENFALCEMLASHGFIVYSIMSRGTENRWLTGNHPKDIETQARDVEFLFTQAEKTPSADLSKVALMAYSFGGLGNIIVQNRNERIKAIVSLDGTERYQYPLMEKLPDFDPDKLDVPYLHMAQKDIPQEVLEKDNIDPVLNSIFQLYDSLSRSNAYKIKLQHLTHSYFSSMGVLFQQRDPRQDKSDPEIMVSYKLATTYTLNFLRAYLYDDQASLEFMNNDPAANEIDTRLIKYESKKATDIPYAFNDFNDLAAENKYEDLSGLYSSAKSEHPGLELPEGNLNTIGLQLTFDPSTSDQGIRVLEFATELYPQSANLFDSLAEAYLHLGNEEKAKENFQKSLDLYPENENAIQRLEQLGK